MNGVCMKCGGVEGSIATKANGTGIDFKHDNPDACIWQLKEDMAHIRDEIDTDTKDKLRQLCIDWFGEDEAAVNLPLVDMVEEGFTFLNRRASRLYKQRDLAVEELAKHIGVDAAWSVMFPKQTTEDSVDGSTTKLEP